MRMESAIAMKMLNVFFSRQHVNTTYSDSDSHHMDSIKWHIGNKLWQNCAVHHCNNLTLGVQSFKKNIFSGT